MPEEPEEQQEIIILEQPAVELCDKPVESPEVEIDEKPIVVVEWDDRSGVFNFFDADELTKKDRKPRAILNPNRNEFLIVEAERN